MRERAPGRQASENPDWYFRMLGMDDHAPTELRDVAANSDSTKTAELVTDMWDQTAEVEPADDALRTWTPTQLTKTAASRRRVRWTLVIAAALVGAAAALALWLLPQASEQRAARRTELIRTSLGTMYGDLETLQQGLATATEPSSETVDLDEVADGLAAVSAGAAGLVNVATRPVPTPLPLSPREPFDTLEQIQTRLAPLAEEATAISAEVGRIAAYRLALDRILKVDDLPAAADSAAATQLGTTLAKVLADSVAALTEMPTTGPFADHRARVEAAVADFGRWQDDYMRALRTGDSEGAGQLVTELLRARRILSQSLVPVLADERTALDGRILDLAGRLATLIESLPL